MTFQEIIDYVRRLFGVSVNPVKELVKHHDEIEQTIRVLKVKLAKAIAEKSKLQQKYKSFDKQIEELDQHIKSLLQQKKEVEAKSLINSKLQKEKLRKTVYEVYEGQERLVSDLNRTLEQMKNRLDEIKFKQQEIGTTYRMKTTQQEVANYLKSIQSKQNMTFSELERIAKKERIEQEMTGAMIEASVDTLEDLNRGSEFDVEGELLKLQAEMGITPSEPNVATDESVESDSKPKKRRDKDRT